ncbi:hypothetical protein MAR_010127 [Mya arenaria]|uniref:Uncharacterized protein n=1 Tax=Mya arenaria TaxID=6604 RepID=A0ABY7E2Y9_MYAAR|nr:hypothetical protein MAR_010127 [Mya arenaria]
MKYAATEAAIAKAEEKAEIEEKEKIRSAAKTRRMAEIDVDLSLLTHKKEVAAMKTEVETLENMSKKDNESHASASWRMLSPENANSRNKKPFKKGDNLKAEAGAKDFTQYLLRKDLLLIKMTYFNDTADSFQPRNFF